MSLQVALNYIEESGLTKSCDVNTMFDMVAATSGKSAEAGLQMMMDNHDTAISALTKAVLLLTMSPFVTYGVGAQTVPEPDTVEPGIGSRLSSWDKDTVRLLQDLAARRLTGRNARDAIMGEMRRLAPESRRLLYRVLVKEMRIGCGPKTVNKFHKGLVPIFEHKGAKRTKEALHKVKWPAWAEYKLDGFRCVAKAAGSVFTEPETYSRNGLPMDNLVPRANDLNALTGYLIAAGVLEDRAWAWDGEGKKMGAHFNATSSEARKAGKGAELTFNIFDLVPWDHLAGGSEPIEARYARLDRVQAWLNANPEVFPMLRTVERFELDCEADAWELYRRARELGHEGLVIKQKGSLYTLGKTEEWVKVKPEETVDLKVTGVYAAEPGSKYAAAGMLGGIVVDFAGVAVRIGSGLSDAQRLAWAEDQTLIVGQVVEILYHEVTPDGSLREPRLKRMRKDKYPEDADVAA